MLDHVLRAFDLLIKSGELGAADCRSLNLLAQHLDQQGETDREAMIELLFAGSKDPDGACRSFLSRLKAGAAQAADEAERSGDTNAAAVFRSLTVARIKAKGGAARLKFSAQAPKELPQVTARANRDYLPEEYLPGTGCKPEDMPKLRRQEEKQLCCLLEGGRKEMYQDREYIPAKGERARVCTAGERHVRRQTADAGEAVHSCEALADMLDWLKDSSSCLYALLGDYGMGKTFTCRIFAQRLAERCQQEPSLPRPVYLDLRDVPTFVTVNGKTRQPTLEEMLETVLRLNEQAEAYTAKELIEAARQGKLLCIFDGLDEKLVFYTADMQSQFLNELLRVFSKEIYLSLRAMPVFITLDGKVSPRQPFLEETIDIALHLNGKANVHKPKELIESARQGKVLWELEGVEAMLKSYPAEMGSKFINELLQVLPQVKIVISCRSHHFETLRQMNSFLLGLNRSGLRGSDYRALHLLPFSGEQMLALLTKLLGAEEAKQIFAFIDSEKYLKDLAQRPFLLRQLSSLLPKLREQKERGEPLNASAFYQALIEDCISRDDEKNLIKPRHKQQLLADLSAEFWRNSTQLWQIDQLNDWFCAWLNKQPELAAQYSNIDGQLLERDLRNSTLLVRFGEKNFGFSHSSMQEFFLSRWLLRQWQEDENFYMEKTVSELTCQFIIDHLDSLIKKNQKKLNHFFVAILSGPWSSVSDYVLKNITRQAEQGLTVPELSKVDLRGSDITDRRIQGLNGTTLLLDSAEAYASQWINCQFQRIEIGTGNIRASLWRDCSWHLFTASFINLNFLQKITIAKCNGGVALPQLHRFPLAIDVEKEILSPECLQQGHRNKVIGCCFSLDGSSILSVADDYILKLWDMKGQCFATFQTDKEGRVFASSFYRDIFSFSYYDDNLKLLDTEGHCIQVFQKYKSNERCFSPNGSRILSVNDGTLRLWNLDGTVERIFAAWEEQWYTAFFRNNQLEKIIGTEMSWKMAHFAKDGKTWTLDETGCFEWVPAQY